MMQTATIRWYKILMTMSARGDWRVGYVLEGQNRCCPKKVITAAFRLVYAFANSKISSHHDARGEHS